MPVSTAWQVRHSSRPDRVCVICGGTAATASASVVGEGWLIGVSDGTGAGVSVGSSAVGVGGSTVDVAARDTEVAVSPGSKGVLEEGTGMVVGDWTALWHA